MLDSGVAFGGPLSHQTVRSRAEIAFEQSPVEGEDCLGTLMPHVEMGLLVLLRVEPVHVDHEAEELRYPRHCRER
jgi:hypothetical protein